MPTRRPRTSAPGTLSLTVGDADPVEIAIDAENNSLEGMMQAINDADAGVTASIINDGTSSPYRLVLTADEVAQAVTLDTSGLAGGTYANPAFTETQTGQKAHVRVDGIDIYGTANSVKEAIPGVTLDLDQGGGRDENHPLRGHRRGGDQEEDPGLRLRLQRRRLFCHQAVGHRRQLRRHSQRGFGAELHQAPSAGHARQRRRRRRFPENAVAAGDRNAEGRHPETG